ncbi:hypothetical protein [Streptomyces sp. NPDC059460]|uniref:hypothetical protein n=1 Tax=Streptomyces sp. NPDC059460 TaxID=3346840 RepID=UPI0036B98A6B
MSGSACHARCGRRRVDTWSIFRLVALAVPPGPEGVVPADEMRRFTRVGDRVAQWIVG